METQNSKRKVQNHSEKRKGQLKYRCYYFSITTLRFVEKLPNNRVYWIIADQLLRSATSIGANIIEAQAASSKRDFIKFFEIALKSANETKYWLCLLRDGTTEGKSKREVIEKYLQEAEEISKMLGSSLLTLKNKK